METITEPTAPEAAALELTEQAIVGAILIDARCMAEITGAITAADFQHDKYRRLYEAARELYEAGAAIDAVTILDRAGGDLKDLAFACMNNTPTAANVGAYCAQLHKAAELHRLQAAALGVATAADLDTALDQMDAAARITEGAKRLAGRKPAFTSYGVGDYLAAGSFDTDIAYFKKYRQRKTGFENIDRYLTLYPGLAALGGSASLGKTTFAVNLADNLAAAGETVLYFAMEQDPVELVTKSLARRLYLKDPFSRINNIDIKNGASSPALEEVKREYAASIGDRFTIVRCNFTTTAEEIQAFVEGYIAKTGRRPVVFVDYLQLVALPPDFRGDIRLATDHIIKAFKAMQINNELLVVLISNFNRASYAAPVSYEAFKETGMIEFTCDYVWGLQLSALEDDEFYIAGGRQGGKETTVKAKKDALYEATKKDPKEVEFVSLKSRNGRQAYKCFFKYNMAYDTFTPDQDSPHDREGLPAGFRNLGPEEAAGLPFGDIPII